MKRNIIIQLNEINFEYFKKYAEKYNLRNIQRTLEWNFLKTNSEKNFNYLEPWIQWTSFYTSNEFSEHGVFRLGDNHNHDASQFFDDLSKKGMKVGCVCPMNAGNSPYNASFYISDPWSNYSQTGSNYEKKIGSILASLINDNNKKNFKLYDLFLFFFALILKGSFFKNFFSYLKLFYKSLNKPWYRPIFLDYFLANFHLNLHKKYKTDLSSIFLNCGAHLQHHYFLNSEFVSESNMKNPDWYLNKKFDPIKDVLEVYDDILEKYLSLKDHKIFIVTGLSQQPSSKPIYYWRLDSHKDFLKLLKIPFNEIYPRMTRDFLINFSSEEDLHNAHNILSELTDQFQEKLFDVLDVRKKEKSIFATLTYSNSLEGKFITIDSQKLHLQSLFNFVAIKNGEHNQKGFCISNTKLDDSEEVNIWDLSNLIKNKITS